MGLQQSYLHNTGGRYLGERGEVLKARLKEWLNNLDKSSNILYFVREIHGQEDAFYRTGITHSLVGSGDIEVMEHFKSHMKLVVNATRYSALHKTMLESELSKIKPPKITLIGVETHTFVMFTAADLRYRGYEVEVIEPLVAAEDDYMHGVGLTVMANTLGVNVLRG